MRHAWAWIAATVVLLVCAASASATTFCVSDAGCVSAGGTAKPDLQTALTAAQTGVNVIDLGPGSYTAPDANGFQYFPGAAAGVRIVGAGTGQTIVQPPAGVPSTVTTLKLAGNASAPTSISNLTVLFGQSSGQPDIGLQLQGAAADHLAVSPVLPVPVAPEPHGNAVDLASGTASLTDCTVTAPDGGNAAAADASGSAVTATIDRCTLTGPYGAYSNPGATLRVAHSTITTTGIAGIYGYGAVTARDDLVRLTAGGQAGVRALSGTPAPLSSGSVDAKGLTILGSGTGSGQIGVDADAGVGVTGTSAHVTLDSSIVRGTVTSLDANQGANSTATITASYSDFAFAGQVGPLFITAITGDVDTVDPQFVDAAGGDYHLSYRSPLIDIGNPLATPADSPQDLGGASRVVDGRIDMGAYEYGRHVPIAVATVTGATVAPARLTFDGSGSSDADPGEALSYAWSFDDGAAASGAIVAHTFITAGPHVATLTVTDPTGLTATAQAKVTVTDAPPISPPPAHRFAGVSFAKSALTLGATGHVGVPLRCPAATPRDCRGTLTVTATLPARKRKHKPAKEPKATKIASATFTIAPGKTKTIVLKLSSAAVRAVAAKHRLSVAASAVAHDGLATMHTTKRTLTISIPKKAKKHHHR